MPQSTPRATPIFGTEIMRLLGPSERSPFRMPDPQPAIRSLCSVTSGLLGRELLFAPEPGEGGAGGADKTFTQAEVDAIIQKRVGPLTDKLKAAEATAARVAEIEAKLAEADQREVTAREEAELKGKTELEKLQIQLQKATEKARTAEGEWTKRLAESSAAGEAERSRRLEYVRRHAVTSALNDAGLAKGAGRAAAREFLAEAQLELDENDEVKAVAVAGKSFPKLDEAAKQFIADNPYFAAVAPGGSGTPRGGNGAGGSAEFSVSSALAQGLEQARNG